MESSPGCWASYGRVLERGVELTGAVEILRRAGRARYPWLEPPRIPAELSVAHVERARGADEHAAAVEEWARSVWASWSAHHEAFRSWLDAAPA